MPRARSPEPRALCNLRPSVPTVRGRVDDLDLALQAARHVHVIVGADDHGLNVGQLLDQCHAFLRPQQEYTRTQAVGDDGPLRDDGDTATESRRLTGGRIEDVVIADTVLDEEPLVVA